MAQTISQVTMVLSWAMDLAAIVGGSEGGGEGFSEDMQTIAGLVRDVGGLAWDIEQLQYQLDTLLNLDRAPNTSAGLQAQTQQMRGYAVAAYGYAMQTQTLINTTIRTIQHILKITQKIADIAGGVSGQQNGQEYLAKLAQLQAQTQVQASAFQRAQTVQQMSEPLTIQAIEQIKVNVRADMPR